MGADEIKIQDCTFISLFCFTSGSVIFGQGITGSFDLFSCTLYNCSSVVSGGAIFYDCGSGGNCNIDKVCASHCFFTGNYNSGNERGQFGFILTSNMKNNSINYLSMLKCAPQMQNGVGSLCLRYGKHYIMNINSSKNQCLYSAMAESVGGNSTFISRCSFVDNVIQNYHNLYLNGGIHSNLIEYCNIIKNNGPSYGVISVQYICIYSLKNSILINNSEYLFGSYGGYGGDCVLTVLNCFVYHSGTLTRLVNGGKVNLLNIEYSITPTYPIIHLESFYCGAEIPLLKQTPNIITIYPFLQLLFVSYILEQ